MRVSIYSGNADGVEESESGPQNHQLFVLFLLAAPSGWHSSPTFHPLMGGTQDFLAIVLTLTGLWMSRVSSEERGFIDQQLCGAPGLCVPLAQTRLGLQGIGGAVWPPLGKLTARVMARQGSGGAGEYTLRIPPLGGFLAPRWRPWLAGGCDAGPADGMRGPAVCTQGSSPPGARRAAGARDHPSHCRREERQRSGCSRESDV